MKKPSVSIGQAVCWLLFPRYRKYWGREVCVLQCVGCKRIGLEESFSNGCPRCKAWTVAWINPSRLETLCIYTGVR